MRIEDTIFAEDNAFLNLIDIIENGRETLCLLQSCQKCAFPQRWK